MKRFVLTPSAYFNPQGLRETLQICRLVVIVNDEGEICDAENSNLKYRLTNDHCLEDWTGAEYELYPSSRQTIVRATNK